MAGIGGIVGGDCVLCGSDGVGVVAMRIVSYVMSCALDTATLADALNSLSHFSDRIYVTDGLMGRGTLVTYPLYHLPIREWLLTRPEYDAGDCLPCRKWNGVPFTLFENEFIHPAQQRSDTLAFIAENDPHADWVVWIDSDEVCSWEMINGIRDILGRVPRNVSDVCQKWLNLVQDEQHCVGGQHSTWLAHSKIHRLGAVRWAGEWHEHGVFSGDRLRWDTYVLHERAFFRRILLVQRGHPVIGKRVSSILPNAPMFWDDAVVEEMPKGVTWPPLHYPEGEIIPFPIEADAAKVWDYKTGEQIGRVEDA